MSTEIFKARVVPALRKRGPAALASVLVFLTVGWFNGRRHIFSPDRDEGYALIQALLVRRGHPLYSETWSDQPPGYTWMIGGFTWLFGDFPEVARLSTALLLSAFVLACFEVCQRRNKGIAGILGGVAATLALLFQSEVFRYGCAAMISLPSMLFIALGWAASALPPSRKSLCMTGVFVALGLAIKPLGAPAVPGIFLGVFLSAFVRGDSFLQRRSWRQALVYLSWAQLPCLLTLALFYWPLLFREGSFTVYQTHEVTRSGWVGLERLKQIIEDDLWLFAGAVLGLVILTLRRRLEVLSLGLWLLLGVLALAQYQPIWSHHRYLVLLPAVPLFALAWTEAAQLILQKEKLLQRALGTLAVISLGGMAIQLFPAQRFEQIEKAFSFDGSKENSVIRLLRKNVPQARRMVTSRQMYAYRLGLDIPPSLAVTSRKRFQRWKLSSKELVETSVAFDPDVVVLDSRWPRAATRQIRQRLSKTHLLVRKRRDEFVLVREVLANSRLKKAARKLAAR